MSNLIYFQPRQYRTPENRMILKFIPRDKTESYKADKAEKILTTEQYVYYLALVIVHQAYYFVSERHQEIIRRLVILGVLDDLAVTTGLNLTDSCVTDKGEFLYNNQEFKLPGDYKPRFRMEDKDGSIYVAGIRPDGKKKMYRFIFKNGKHKWEKVDDEPERIIDF